MTPTSAPALRTIRATPRGLGNAGVGHARAAGAEPRRSGAIRLGAAVALASVLGAVGPRAARADDDWLGPDKALHFSVSIALASGGYAASALVWDERWARASAGATFALTLGATKELFDLAGLGDPSWRDFTWDVLGTAVGVLLALGVDLLVDALDARDVPARRAAVCRWARPR